MGAGEKYTKVAYCFLKNITNKYVTLVCYWAAARRPGLATGWRRSPGVTARAGCVAELAAGWRVPGSSLPLIVP